MNNVNKAFTNFRTLGLGAGHGRVVDREIQRESLLCPDYLKVLKLSTTTIL